MSNVVDTIRQQHQRLLELVDQVPGEDVTADAQQFLGQIGEAGAEVRDPRQRSQLRALVRFWGSFIYDGTGEFPRVELLPAVVEREQPEDEPVVVAEGAGRALEDRTSAARPEIEPGSQFGTYEILDEIGHGGFSKVFKAFDTVHNRIVALKILQDERFTTLRFCQQFVEHEQLVQQLDHPHIILVYEVGIHKDIPYVTMQLVEGGSVADRLTDWYWRPTVREMLEIARQAADGLEYLHQRQIVHRDIKPANLLLTFDDRVYLTDFGIAQVMENAFGGMVVGTPEYMAPEAILHPESVDGRTDLYSLGVVMFELMTGTRPFRANSPEELMHMQVNEVPPDAAEITDLPQSVSNLVNGCLAKKPDERPQSATALKAKIEQLLVSLSQEALAARPAHFVSPPETRVSVPPTTVFYAPEGQEEAPTSASYERTMVVGSVPLPRREAVPPAPPPVPRPYAADVETRLMYTTPMSIAWLVVTTGPRRGQTFRLSESTSIGRDTVNDIILDDETVSCQHVRIEQQDSNFCLYDLASANSSFVNERAAMHRIRLSDGDTVRLGEVELVFKLAAISGGPPPQRRPQEGVLAILIVSSGPRRNDYYVVERERSTLGSSRYCDILIQDETTSAQHALLVYDKSEGKQGTFTLYDLATVNGTTVNGEPIIVQRLKHNDTITVGETELLLKRLDQ